MSVEYLNPESCVVNDTNNDWERSSSRGPAVRGQQAAALQSAARGRSLRGRPVRGPAPGWSQSSTPLRHRATETKPGACFHFVNRWIEGD